MNFTFDCRCFKRGKPAKKALTNTQDPLPKEPPLCRQACKPRLSQAYQEVWLVLVGRSWLCGHPSSAEQPQLCGLLGWAAGPHGSSPSCSLHHTHSPAAKGCQTLPAPYSCSGTRDVQGLGSHSLSTSHCSSPFAGAHGTAQRRSASLSGPHRPVDF